MESERISSFQSQSPLNLQHLKAFEHITSFNLFLFSRREDNLPLFLFHKADKSQVYSHWFGVHDRHDPNIYFAIIREFITQNHGLLYTPNLKQFLAGSANLSTPKGLVLEDNLTEPVRAQTGFTKPIDDICRLLSETPYIFQDQQGCVTYFIEFPFLDLKAMNEIAKRKRLNFTMKYYTFEEIIDAQNKEVYAQCLKNINLRAYAQRFIVDSEPIVITERYAIISCEPRVVTYMMHGLHYPIYKKHGEHWSFYKAFEGEFPSDDELKTFKGVIIPGSSCSAYDKYWPWYGQLFKVIDKIVNGKNHINLLGICFGAQIIAQALGGQVEQMDGSFIRGGDQLQMKSSFYKLDYIRKAEIKTTDKLVIAESHGDHIVKLPTRAVLQGSSVHTDVECYTIENKVFALQGHPEYNEAWTARAACRMWYNSEDYDVYADKYIKEKFSLPITRKNLTKICYTFLKKGNEEIDYSGA